MLNDEPRESLRARGYADHTLRQRKMLGSWLAAYEQERGELLDSTTYDLATHDRVLHFLRFDQNLAQNTVASVVRGLKMLPRWCREERGMTVPVELRKLQGKHADILKMWLTAEDLKALATAVLPSHFVRVRDVLMFCCYTGLRYQDFIFLHSFTSLFTDEALANTRSRCGKRNFAACRQEARRGRQVAGSCTTTNDGASWPGVLLGQLAPVSFLSCRLVVLS